MLSPYPELLLLIHVSSSTLKLEEIHIKHQRTHPGEILLNLYGLKVGAWQKRTDEPEGQMARQVDQKR